MESSIKTTNNTLAAPQPTKLQELLFDGEKVSLLTYFFSAAIIVAVMVVACVLHIELYVLLSVIGLLLIWAMVYYPKIWIFTIALGLAIFVNTDEGVSVIDILAAIFFNSFLIFWFVKKLLAQKAKHLINPDATTTQSKNFCVTLHDKLFLLFYLFLTLNCVIAIANNVEFFEWVREYLLYTLILYYFPIREYFFEEDGNTRSIVILLFLFSLAVLFLDMKQFYNYYKLLGNIKYAYQIGVSIRLNQQIYSAAVISGITLFFYSKTFWGRLLSFAVTLLSTAAIVSTFSRAFWMAILALIVVLFLYIRPRQILELFLIVLLSAGIMWLAIDTFFPKQSKFMTTYIEKRFNSTSKGIKKDPSLQSRLREYNVVVQRIEETPITGQGIRKDFSFYNNITNETKITSFIHNGYLNIAYKAGIPMAILFYTTMACVMFKGFITSFKLKNVYYKYKNNKLRLYTALAICGSLSLAMLFITNFVTSSFLFRDGLLVTAFAIAFIDISDKQLQNFIKKEELCNQMK